MEFIKEVNNEEEYTNQVLNKENKRIKVVLFSAPWASEMCKVQKDLLIEFYKNHKDKVEMNLSIYEVPDTEKMPNICMKIKIDSVPSVVIYGIDGKFDTLTGVNPEALLAKINSLIALGNLDNGQCINNKTGDEAPAVAGQTLEDRIKALLNKDNIMIFMKGNPQQPKCGFSRTLIGLINDLKVPYSTFDILEDEEIRQGLKEYSNWPTYPQLYHKGELLGGLDVIKEMNETNELLETLKS